MVSRRELLKLATGASLLPGGLTLAGARLLADEGWPTRTITIVVPFAPGGTADFAARPLANYLQQKLGRNVVVENRGGAGGGIGHTYVARAEPDGYTIMTALPSLGVIPEANRLMGQAVTYEMDQFVPIARMFADPIILAVKKTSPWNTLRDFVAAVKSNPGQISYASSGYLGTAHLAMEMFLRAADLKMVHVPFQGGGPAFASFVADHVPVIPTLESIAKGQIEAGNIRVLAQWGTERLPSFPDVPTVQQAGYPEVVYILWTGVFAPRKTPGHVLKILRDAIRPFMQDKAVVERFIAAGSQVSYMDGPEFEEFLKDDTDRLVKIVRKIRLS